MHKSKTKKLWQSLFEVTSRQCWWKCEGSFEEYMYRDYILGQMIKSHSHAFKLQNISSMSPPQTLELKSLQFHYQKKRKKKKKKGYGRLPFYESMLPNFKCFFKVQIKYFPILNKKNNTARLGVGIKTVLLRNWNELRQNEPKKP